MRASTRSELNKLREIVGFLVGRRCCTLCGEPLLDAQTRRRMWELEGTGRGVPVDPKALSIHHPHHGRKILPGELTHHTCHMRHEAKTRNRDGNRFTK